MAERRNSEEYIVVKGSIPSSLKLRFKVICVQKKLNMTEVLEELIRRWIQADAPISNFVTDLSNEDYEAVKGYIPQSLKLKFKNLCKNKRVKMRSVLYNLINEWVKTEGEG